MKTIYLVIAWLFCGYFFSEVTGQTVSYGYDAAGNRISRVIVMPALRSAANAEQEEPPVYSEMLHDLEIRIYPNPTDGILKVEVLNLPEETEVRLSLYNLSGKLLMDTKNVSGYDTLDLTGQPAGTYILRIVAGEDRSEWKIIKK